MRDESKPEPPEDLQVSVLTHESGKYVVFSWADEAPAAESTPPPGSPRAPATSLTAAERAVHALLLAGLSDAEIAAVRGTTRSTVTKQIDAVFRKLGVNSRRALIARGD